ncbi:MAG: copper homeostasis protein CutC [Armatimonadaceae bacterium]
METPVLVEIVCCSPADARAAAQGGAHRIELCAALPLGGLTPSAGLMEAVREAVVLPIMAMVRPRAGGFQYDADELRWMEREARYLVRQGVDGIVFGALTEDFAVSADGVRRLVGAVEGKETVFHRAFDVTADPAAALETLISLGITRILTSGQRKTALEGAPLIRRLREQAGSRVSLLPGGGIRSHNVREIVAQTGCREVHLAPMQTVSAPVSPNPDVSFGDYSAISEAAVREVVTQVSDG